MADLHELTATDGAHRIASGEITCEALVAACLERIAAREPAVQAWQFIDPHYALKQARDRDRAAARGPLHGVPVGIKDIFDTFDMPTAYGSPIYASYRPTSDAATVALLRAAGAVIMGKTVTTEFAARHPGKTRNPHNPAHTPGGSSSGSAAAVGDRMVPAAFGSQTAGSVIRPAAFCGTVGFKPSFGLFNRRGMAGQAESLDTVGFMVRSIDDAELLTAVLTGRAPPAAGRMPARPPSIGICRTHLWAEADPAARNAVEDAAKRLAAAGAAVKDAALPDGFAAITPMQWKVLAYEASRALAFEWHHYRDKLSAAMQDIVRLGLETPFDEYLGALRLADECRAAFPGVIEPFDMLLTFSAQGEAPAGLGATGDVRFQTLWSFLHVPVITLPTHTGPNGLPVGVLAVGRFRDDDALMMNARWVMRKLMG
jgi:amidase